MRRIFPGSDDVGLDQRGNSKGTERKAAPKAGALFIGNAVEEPAGKMRIPADDAGKRRRDDEMRNRSVAEA